MSPAASLARVLADRAHRHPERAALTDGRRRTVSYARLHALVAAEGAALGAVTGPLGLLAENGVDTAVIDVATHVAGVPTVPLPPFFSDDQLRHIVDAARISTLVTDDEARAVRVLEGPATAGPLGLRTLHRADTPTDTARARIPAPIFDKLTFTSGTTSAPKGVRLDARTLEDVARVLTIVAPLAAGDVHVCALPLSTLLENVGGLYRALLAGATAVVAPLTTLGVGDIGTADGTRLREALGALEATSTILVPEMLGELVVACEGHGRPPHLSVVGVGGAPVPRSWLDRAAAVGLPVRQGYGLSEAGSVVALDTGDAPPGSCGRALPGRDVTVSDEGELLVSGPRALGYLDAPLTLDGAGRLRTGDLGEVADDGFVFVRGRRATEIVTARGRNIAPEWIERELRAEPELLDALVLGNGLSRPVAVVVRAPLSDDSAHAAIERVNARLPGYARVSRWIDAHAPLPDPARRDASTRARAATTYLPLFEGPPPRSVADAAAPPPPEPDPMSFFAQLRRETADDQQALLSIPFVEAARAGRLRLEQYLAFLEQAYHHVRHTAPLFMAAGARLAPHQEWARDAIAHYISEEIGHDRWILDDIAACGGDADAVARGEPGEACETMVAFAYDVVTRRNPLGMLGMVHVLEGTSVRAATQAADALRASLGLPADGVRYLSSHGELDVEHVASFEHLVDRVDDAGDRAFIVHCAHRFFALYGAVLEPLRAASPAEAVS